MNTAKKLFIMILLLSLLSGCTKPVNKPATESATELPPEETVLHTPQGEFKVELSPNDKTIFDLATEVYSYEQLEEISVFEGTIQELNEKYPIYCIRQNQFTGALSYENLYEKYHGEYPSYSEKQIITPYISIYYLGEDNYITILLIDSETGEIICPAFNIWHAVNSKSDFEKKRGVSMELVQRMDPEGDFLFLHTSGIVLPPISYHYTTDGYCVGIEYDDNGLVENLDYYLI